MHELAQIVNLVVRTETILIFARVLLSWFPGIPPWHPLVRALASVTDPILLPFRRMLPTIGGLDFSPIVAIIALQVVGNFVVDLWVPRVITGDLFSDVFSDVFPGALGAHTADYVMEETASGDRRTITLSGSSSPVDLATL